VRLSVFNAVSEANKAIPKREGSAPSLHFCNSQFELIPDFMRIGAMKQQNAASIVFAVRHKKKAATRAAFQKHNP
jgi:hypothetical protein